ncbi:hypothetical protein DPMN_150809 [Dreissena polymorpha]|uniref:Uncharacterized protein n=1 Tax=Dreissena polymorpha TaxID=45954 RepID=A0A9D4FF92_DREPO|nr:hypothetical protein DPMN_150809 [Dreissena polymorpha]
MIPEEEFEMSSDDEISISVPHALNRKRTEMDISACVGIEHSSINYIDFNYVQPLNEQPLHNHVHSLSEKDNLNMERQRINLGGTTRSGSANEIIKQPDNSSEQSNKKTSPKHDNSVFYVTTHTLVTPSPMQQIESSGKEYAAQEQRQQFQTKSEVTQSLEKRTTGMTSLFAETNTDSNIYGELQLQALILKPNSPFTDIEKQSLREDTGASSDFKADIITPIIENENNLTNNEMEDFGRTFVKTELEDTIRNAYLDHRIESYTGHNCETDKINEEQLKTCHDIRGNASELYMDGRISRHMLHISQTHETSSNIINDSKSSCVESDETFATTIDFADRKCDLAKMDTDWNDIFLDEELLTVFSRVNTPESGEESDIEILKSDKVKQNSVRVSKISVPSITFSEASDSLTSSVSIVENSKEYIAMNEINTDESDDNSDEGTEIDGEDNDDKMEEEEEEDDDYFCDDNNTHNTDQSITDASDDDEVHSLQHERTCKHGVDNVVYSPNHTAPTNVADLSYEEVVNGSNDKSYADNGKSSSETIKATSECNTNCENPEAHRNINKTDNISKSVQNIKRHFVVAAFASMSKRKIGSQNDKINSMRTKKSERKDNSQSLRKIKLKSRVRRLQPDTEPYAVKDSETDSMDKTILIRRPDLSTHLPVVSKQAQTVSSITIQELKINTRTTKRLENTYLDKNMLVKPVAPISRSQTKLSSAKGKTGKSVNNNVTISGNNNHTKTNVLSYTHGNEYKTNRTESDKDNVFENSNKYNCTQNAEIRENAIKPSFDRRLLSMEKEIGNCPIKRCVPHTASTQFVYKKHDPAILSLRRIYQKNRPREKANSSIDYVYTGPLQTKENSFKMRSSFRNMSTPSFLRTKSLASKKVKSEKSALVQTTSNREKNNDGQQVNHAMDVMTPKNTKYFENNDITIKNEIKDMILENVSPLTETSIRHDEMGSSQINEETTEATNSKRIVMTVDNNSDFPSTSLMTSRDVSSPFTDTARLLKIRRLLQLPSDDFQMSTHEYVDEKGK